MSSTGGGEDVAEQIPEPVIADVRIVVLGSD